MGQRRCQGCHERDAVIADLQPQVAALRAEVRDRKARLGQNASNSSLPPSAQPLHAPKPVTQKPSERQPGGPPGPARPVRRRLPPQRVQQVSPWVPTTWARCPTAWPAERGPADPEPTWHPVAELPDLTAAITAYPGHARTCPCGGDLPWAVLPAAVRAHRTGPRRTATLAYFSACHHRSRRGVEAIAATVCGVPLTLGTLANLEQEVRQAWVPAHTEAGGAVQEAAVQHADETRGKQAGPKCWLGVGATALVAFWVSHARRSVAGLTALLGATIQGLVCSDRWGAQQRMALTCRQLGGAHRKRDFPKCVDRGGAAVAIGPGGLAVVQALFERGQAFRGGGRDRAGLQVHVAPRRRPLHTLLESGGGCVDSPAAPFCRQLLAGEPAWWTCVAVAGVEPTNNHAERLQRTAVLWRKNAFGSRREAGCRFVERLLTVVQTLRLQKRQVLDYLHRAVAAHRAGLPAPKLLPCD